MHRHSVYQRKRSSIDDRNLAELRLSFKLATFVCCSNICLNSHKVDETVGFYRPNVHVPVLPRGLILYGEHLQPIIHIRDFHMTLSAVTVDD